MGWRGDQTNSQGQCSWVVQTMCKGPTPTPQAPWFSWAPAGVAMETVRSGKRQRARAERSQSLAGADCSAK